MTEWEVRTDPADPNSHDVWVGPVRIARLPWCRETEARMIAAAPALLEALRRAELAMQNTKYPNDAAIASARAAIGKAEGR